jgi:hypothetical protein
MMETSLQRNWFMVIRLCFIWSLCVGAVTKAEEPWRPETAAAVGRALALAEPSEEEEDFAASLGGVQAGISPVYAGMNMPPRVGRIATGLGIASAAMGNEITHFIGSQDTHYKWTEYDSGFSSEISISHMNAHVKILSPQGTTVYDQVRSLQELPQMQSELDSLAYRWHDTARRMGLDSHLSEQAFLAEGNRSWWEHATNSVLTLASTMSGVISGGYPVTGLTMSGMAYGATIAKDGGMRVLPPMALASDAKSFVLDSKALAPAGPAISMVDFFWSTGLENRRSANALAGLQELDAYRHQSIRQLNNESVALWDASRTLEQLKVDIKAESGSYKSYISNLGFNEYGLAKNPNVDALTRVDASTAFAKNYMNPVGDKLTRDVFIDKTLYLYEDGFRQLPNASNVWVPKDIMSTTSYATNYLSQAKNPTEWAKAMGRLGQQGITVVTSPYTHGDYSFSSSPGIGSVPVPKVPECHTYSHQVPDGLGGFSTVSYTICY